MKRKVLILWIFSMLLLIATLCIWHWEVQRELSTPTQDDIFGHTGAVLVMGIVLLAVLVGQWEFYRGLKYFFADTARTDVKNVSNAIAVGLSALMLGISAVTYLFFMERAVLCVYYMLLTGGLLVCNRLVTSIYIAWNVLDEAESAGAKAWRIVNIAIRFLILIPVGFGCFVGLLYLFTSMGI